MARNVQQLVVVADDDDDFRELIKHYLTGWGIQQIGVPDKGTLLYTVEQKNPDLILLDLYFGEHDGVEVLQELRARTNPPEVVMTTAHGSINNAVAAIRLGAADYLTKPVDLNRLRETVNHLLDAARTRRSAPSGPSTESSATRKSTSKTTSRSILGKSNSIKELRELIERVAPTDATVLIQAESGTGKELVARALHELSPRNDGPFIPLNVASLPRELVESTLFGHEKGAFTGADRLQRGCCEAADGGTLFLDEIGEMELGLQAKLLRFLQERTVTRVGSNDPIKVDVRILAATHRDLGARVAGGQFRDDLYYRLNVVPLTIAPLREHTEDIPLLADHFLSQACARHRNENLQGFTPEAHQALAEYRWPGNVRQLENLVERLAILNSGPWIDFDTVRKELPESSPVSPAPVDDQQPGSDLRKIDLMEKEAIVAALQRSKGSVSQAAKELGLSPATIYRKMKRFSISR